MQRMLFHIRYVGVFSRQAQGAPHIVCSYRRAARFAGKSKLFYWSILP